MTKHRVFGPVTYDQHWRADHEDRLRRNAAGKRWHWVSWFMVKQYAKPCVYALYVNGVLAYIGSTENFARRWRQHQFGKRLFTPWSDDDRLSVKIKESNRTGDWLMREYRLIRRLNPFLNRIYNHKGIEL